MFLCGALNATFFDDHRDEFVRAIAEQIASMIEEGTPLNAIFDQVLTSAADLRHIAAERDEDPETESFGRRIPLEGNIVTPLGACALTNCLALTGLRDCLARRSEMFQCYFPENTGFYQRQFDLTNGIATPGARLLMFGQMSAGLSGSDTA